MKMLPLARAVAITPTAPSCKTRHAVHHRLKSDSQASRFNVGKIHESAWSWALARVGLTGVVHADDVLPTTKPAPTASENCFANLSTCLDSTAADCPLSYGPFTLYATLDAGLMYNTNGAPWSPRLR